MEQAERNGWNRGTGSGERELLNILFKGEQDADYYEIGEEDRKKYQEEVGKILDEILDTKEPTQEMKTAWMERYSKALEEMYGHYGTRYEVRIEDIRKAIYTWQSKYAPDAKKPQVHAPANAQEQVKESLREIEKLFDTLDIEKDLPIPRYADPNAIETVNPGKARSSGQMMYESANARMQLIEKYDPKKDTADLAYAMTEEYFKLAKVLGDNEFEKKGNWLAQQFKGKLALAMHDVVLEHRGGYLLDQVYGQNNITLTVLRKAEELNRLPQHCLEARQKGLEAYERLRKGGEISEQDLIDLMMDEAVREYQWQHKEPMPKEEMDRRRAQMEDRRNDLSDVLKGRYVERLLEAFLNKELGYAVDGWLEEIKVRKEREALEEAEKKQEEEARRKEEEARRKEEERIAEANSPENIMKAALQTNRPINEKVSAAANMADLMGEISRKCDAFYETYMLETNGTDTDIKKAAEKAKALGRQQTPEEARAALTEVLNAVEEYAREHVSTGNRLAATVQQFHDVLIGLNARFDMAKEDMDKAGLSRRVPMEMQFSALQQFRTETREPKQAVEAAEMAAVVEMQVNEQLRTAKKALEKMKKLDADRASNSEQFKNMYTALQEVCGLSVKNSPDQVQQAFDKLYRASNAYEQKIRIKGGGHLGVGGKRLDLARELQPMAEKMLKLSPEMREMDQSRPITGQKLVNADAGDQKKMDYLDKVQKMQLGIMRYLGGANTRSDNTFGFTEKIQGGLDLFNQTMKTGEPLSHTRLGREMKSLEQMIDSYLSQDRLADREKVKRDLPQEAGRMNFAQALKSSLQKWGEELDKAFAESGFEAERSFDKQMEEIQKKRQQKQQETKEIQEWVQSRAESFLADLAEQQEKLRQVGERLQAVAGGSRSNEFNSMKEALERVLHLGENDSPKKVQESFAELNAASHTYMDMIRYNERGKGITGGKRVQIAKELEQLSSRGWQISDHARALDLNEKLSTQKAAAPVRRLMDKNEFLTEKEHYTVNRQNTSESTTKVVIKHK